MKTFFLTITFLLSANLMASNLRDNCENAYYAGAGGVTKLHQYKVIVNWGKLSDTQLSEFEDIIYAENGSLSILTESNFESRSGNLLSAFIMSESKGLNYRDYVNSLTELAAFAAVSVSCL
jgi:hypothetical protein